MKSDIEYRRVRRRLEIASYIEIGHEIGHEIRQKIGHEIGKSEKKKRTRIRHEFGQKNRQEFFRSVLPTILGQEPMLGAWNRLCFYISPQNSTPGTFYHKGRSKAVEFSCVDEFIVAKMAVFCCCENRLLADHQRSISESVSELSLCCKDSLFALFEPYFRSSVTNSGTHKRKVSLLNTD